MTEVRAQEVSARVLAKLSYRADPEGVIAVVEAPRREFPRDATLLLVAVGIEKPGNLGAMARTADAAGADALLVADGATDPWNPNAIRASTGAVFTLPVLAMPTTSVPNSSGAMIDLIIRRKIVPSNPSSLACAGATAPNTMPPTRAIRIHVVSDMRFNVCSCAISLKSFY